MTFNDFIKKYNLRNKAASNIKIYEVLKNIGLSDFFKNLGRKGLNVSKKMAKNVLSSPGRALDLTAKKPQQLLLIILNRLYQHYQN